MKNKKGFTFIEILAVIFIISVLIIIIVPSVQKVNRNAKIKQCKNKFTLIEESVNLWAQDNIECFENIVSDKCNSYNSVFYGFYETERITNIENLARNGIIEFDTFENEIGKVINPLNQNVINNYEVSVKYENNRITTTIENPDNESVTPESTKYASICEITSSNKIDDDKDVQEYIKTINYIVNECKSAIDSEHCTQVANNIKIENYSKSKLRNECQKRVPENYYFSKYETSIIDEKNSILNCLYKAEKKFKLTLKYDNKSLNITEITPLNEKNEYFENTTITIKYQLDNNYKLGAVTCSNTNTTCETDIDNNIITVKMPSEDLNVEIDTVSAKYNVKKYVENANDDNYSLKETKVDTIQHAVDLDNYCTTNAPAGTTFYKDKSSLVENNIDCYYKLNRFSLNITKDANVTGYSLTPVQDNYKIGQTITLNYTFNSGYGLKTLSCSKTSACNNYDSQNAIITMPDLTNEQNKVLNIDITSQPVVYYTANLYVEDPNNEAYIRYSSAQRVGVTDESSAKSGCNNIKPSNYVYVGALSSIDKTNKKLNCYYNGKDVAITYDFGDPTDKIGSYSPKTNSKNIFTPAVGRYDLPQVFKNDYSTHTITYHYGKNIYLYNNLNPGYTIDRIECREQDKCTNVAKMGVISVPSEAMTVKPKIKEKKEKVKVIVYLENADDENMIHAHNYETVQQDVVFKNSNEDMLKEICWNNMTEQGNSHNPNYSYYDEIAGYYDFTKENGMSLTLSYVDTSTINKVAHCYYKRKKYNLIYDFRDNLDQEFLTTKKENNRKYFPSSATDYSGTELKNYYEVKTVQYKAGQKIILLNHSNSGYRINPNNTNNCTYTATGISYPCKFYNENVVITMPPSDLNLRPNIEQYKETVNINVFLENADDENIVRSYKYDVQLKDVVLNGSRAEYLTRACYTYLSNPQAASGHNSADYDYSYIGGYFDFTTYENGVIGHINGDVGVYDGKLGYIGELSYIEQELPTKPKEIYCYYHRKRTKLTYKFDNKTESIKFTPSGAVDYSSTTITNDNIINKQIEYKAGQKIYLFATFKNGKDFNSLVNDDSTKIKWTHYNETTRIEGPTEDFVFEPKVEATPETVNIKIYAENADDENIMRAYNLDTTLENVTLDGTNEEVLTNACYTLLSQENDYNKPSNGNTYDYAYINGYFEFKTKSLGLSYIEQQLPTDNRTFHCYLARKRVKLTYKFNSTTTNTIKIGYAPAGATSYSSATVQNPNTIDVEYKAGQKIYLYTDFIAGNDFNALNLNETDSNFYKPFWKHYNKTTEINMATKDFVFEPKVEPTPETVKINVYLENANDENLIRSYNYDATLSNIYLTGTKNEYLTRACYTEMKNAVTDIGKYYAFDTNVSLYLSNIEQQMPGDIKTIHCYYTRKLFNVTFDLSDQNILSKTIFPNNPFTNSSTTITTQENQTLKFKYGQNVAIKANTTNAGYNLTGYTCQENDEVQGIIASTACMKHGDTILIKVPNNITVKPLSG